MQFHRVRVVRRMPHPGNGFTQGLIAEWSGQDSNSVWESTGQYGQSTLRRYEAGASVPLAEAELPAEFFGEGICRVGDAIWQLTWRERVALRWDAASLELREQVRYNREGWGMCAVGGATSPPEVITSDGTSELVRRDPETLEPREVVHVRWRGQRVLGLNDLTWAGGLVWANVAGTNSLAGIDLASGEITDVVDARAAAERHWGDPQAIMNGLAALATPGEFLLTGKGWKSIRQVRLEPDRDRGHIDRLLAGIARLTIMVGQLGVLCGCLCTSGVAGAGGAFRALAPPKHDHRGGAVARWRRRRGGAPLAPPLSHPCGRRRPAARIVCCLR